MEEFVHDQYTRKAMELVRKGQSFFITGKAGTGKTMLLKKIVQECRARGKNITVTAPTGIAAKNAEGLVIAGAGAGEFSEGFINVINELDIPVVISSRIDDGIITQDSVLCDNTVAANDLSPQKAAILLRLAIMNKTTSKEELIRLFDTY